MKLVDDDGEETDVKVPCDTGAVHNVMQEAVTHDDAGVETDVMVPCHTGSLHKVKQEVDESIIRMLIWGPGTNLNSIISLSISSMTFQSIFRGLSKEMFINRVIQCETLRTCDRCSLS